MCKNPALIGAYVIALIALSAAVCLSQIVPYPTPEAGVNGSGAIQFGADNTVGSFNMDVSGAGRMLFGGFQFSENQSGNLRGNYIYSNTIETLEVQDNSATVTATGYWNNMPCIITLQVLDDDANGDWFRIVAQPLFVDVTYEAASSVILGNLVVFRVPPPDCFANGLGSITVNGGRGTFEFSVGKSNGVVNGGLTYEESLSSRAFLRPRASIYLPLAVELSVLSTDGMFSGIGTLNGLPATIEVRVTDLNPAYPVADGFYIRATPLNVNLQAPGGYQAGGPIVAGQINLGIVTPPAQ
jgi:hypothetical protein